MEITKLLMKLNYRVLADARDGMRARAAPRGRGSLGEQRSRPAWPPAIDRHV